MCQAEIRALKSSAASVADKRQELERSVEARTRDVAAVRKELLEARKQYSVSDVVCGASRSSPSVR